MAIGFTLPFMRSSGSLGYLQTTENELEAVTQNLRSLLLTNWGERVLHYNFGCNLREFIFSQQDDDLKQKIADRILTQVATWMPFVSVDDLQILFSREVPSIQKESFLIRIKFSLLNTPQARETLNLAITQ